MIARVLALCCALAAAPFASAATLYSCPQDGGAGDQLARGFYVQNFPAASLDTVALRYIGGPAGTYNVTVTARLDSYTGVAVGSATQDVSIATSGGSTNATFTLGGTTIPAGSTVTFTQVVNSGPGTLFYDTGLGPCANVVQTQATTAPLDAFRRNSAGIVITGTPGAVVSVTNPVPASGPLTLAALVATIGLLAALRVGRNARR